MWDAAFGLRPLGLEGTFGGSVISDDDVNRTSMSEQSFTFLNGAARTPPLIMVWSRRGT